MEKSNTQVIYDLLKVKPLRSSEIEEQSKIPSSTLYRTLTNMIEDKLIKKSDSVYSIIIPTPSVKDIYDSMSLFHQQRLMDYKYRKMKPETKLDTILVWFIENPQNIKGQIIDYNEKELEKNIFKSITMMKHSVN